MPITKIGAWSPWFWTYDFVILMIKLYIHDNIHYRIEMILHGNKIETDSKSPCSIQCAQLTMANRQTVGTMQYILLWPQYI